MACSGCGTAACAAGRFFSRFARSSRRRYQRRGLERSQKQLIEGLMQAGIANASILEIGSGVGYLHQLLLEQGAARATGVDLSEAMLVQARELAGERGLSERVEYRQGDFTELATALPQADVTILDKVVCCYPDAENLVHLSLGKTRRVYALTLPRDHFMNHLGVVMLAFFLWLVRSPFRNYVHDPDAIRAWIEAPGFRPIYENRTLLWLTQVYVRD